MSLAGSRNVGGRAVVGDAIIGLPVASPACGGDNCSMDRDSREGYRQSSASLRGPAPRLPAPFLPGSMVVVTLCNPRDKFWGMILASAPEGLSLSGIELASFEDLVVMVKGGEAFIRAVIFFPMHRIERIELDLPDGRLPSLSQRFSAKTGFDPTAMLGWRAVNKTLGEGAGATKTAVRSSRKPA